MAKWMQKAIKRPGALTKKAKAAGQTISEFCADTSGKSTRTKKQCNLAKTFKKYRKKRKTLAEIKR